MTAIPLWAGLGILIAILQALRPLVQERWRARAFPVAILNKVVIAILSLPLALWFGLPHEPRFYLGLLATSAMWCVSDIAYFRAVEQYGAGPVSRLLPGAIIVSFLLWFAFDPALLARYAAAPWISAGILASLTIAALCSSSLSRCTVSRGAFRALWPTFAAATIGPIVMKLVLQTAPASQVVFGYVFIESAIMIGYFAAFVGLRRLLGTVPRPDSLLALHASDLRAPATVKVSLAIGAVMLFVIGLRSVALLDVDNPAYVTVLAHTDVLWILLVYRLTGRAEQGKVAAGLGVAASAAGILLLRSWL